MSSLRLSHTLQVSGSIDSINGKKKKKGSGGITLNGKTKAMHYEMSDEPIVAMKVKPVKYRTCIAGYRGRLYEDKT